MITLSLSKAKELGLVRYFTGKPCQYGHISERLVSNWNCVECANNPNKKLSIKKWNLKNEKKLREYKKKYRSNDINLQKDRSYTKLWIKNNSDKVRSQTHKYYNKNIDRMRAKNRIYCKNNPEKYRAYANNRRSILANAKGSYKPEDVNRIYKEQKGKCAYCKKVLKSEYHVDHVIPISKGGENLPRNIQVTCPNCNLRKKDKMPEDFAREQGLLI